MENGPYSQVCVLCLNMKTILRKKWRGRGSADGRGGVKNLNFWRGLPEKIGKEVGGGGGGGLAWGRGHEPWGSYMPWARARTPKIPPDTDYRASEASDIRHDAH